MRPRRIRLVAASAGLLSLAHAYGTLETAPAMARAARHFLTSLSAEQRAQTVFPLETEQRAFWHFIPSPDIAKRFGHPRPGLTLREMTAEQRHLASALLSAGLSREGYQNTRTIMSLEEVLRVQEGDSGERRDPLKYHFSIFGDPAAGATWGYRVEGHHVSLHYLVAGGRVVAAPSFFGANPREIREGPRKGWRTLDREEDLARDLLLSLNDKQRNEAIVADKAYPDILTGAERKAVIENQPAGLRLGEMNGEQRAKIAGIVALYAAKMPEEVERHRLQQFEDAGENVWFAWAGSAERDDPHYYRIRTERFLIEYDCTQNGANHIHSVWRDFEGDFGFDLLAR